MESPLDLNCRLSVNIHWTFSAFAAIWHCPQSLAGICHKSPEQVRTSQQPQCHCSQFEKDSPQMIAALTGLDFRNGRERL